jgi:4a-hydroxytetrahydrobiopterin dehydratase
VSVLTDTEVTAGLAALQAWRHEGQAIVREFTLDGGFMGSIGFVNRLAEAAEAMDHHPDLAISWNTVTVSIGSHRLGGVTPQCLELAAKADLLAG